MEEMDFNTNSGFSIKEMKQGVGFPNYDTPFSVQLFDKDQSQCNEIIGEYSIMVCADKTPISICKTIPVNINKNELYIVMDDIINNAHGKNELLIDPQSDFFVTYSTIQCWIEHDYDPTLIHSVLANQLIKAMVKMKYIKFIDIYLLELEKYFIPENKVWLSKILSSISEDCFFLIIHMIINYDIKKKNIVVRHLIEGNTSITTEMFDYDYIIKYYKNNYNIDYDNFIKSIKSRHYDKQLILVNFIHSSQVFNNELFSFEEIYEFVDRYTNDNKFENTDYDLHHDEVHPCYFTFHNKEMIKKITENLHYISRFEKFGIPQLNALIINKNDKLIINKDNINKMFCINICGNDYLLKSTDSNEYIPFLGQNKYIRLIHLI
jgi:hypothetical protein